MRVLRASLLAVFLVLLLVPGLARAAGYGELGTLERGAVDAALAARGLALDPSPEGKMVGFIHVVNLDVFQPSDGRLLEWFNHFHRTTPEHHVRRESLIASGAPYDPALSDETVRNLRNQSTYDLNDTGLSGVVAIVPVQTAVPGTVDLLMVTRDLWSLRFNSDWSFEPIAGYLYTLNASLSENNLFGWRKQVALVFLMDPGEMRLGPNYIDPNVLGTRLRLSAAFYEIWARQIGQLAAGPREGSAALLRLEYPLYALSRHWGAFAQGSYTNNVARAVSGTSLTRYDPNSIDNPCVVPGGPYDPARALTGDCAYRSHVGGVTSGVTRSFPRDWLIQRVTVGNEFGLRRRSFLPGYPSDPALRASFAETFFMASERTSSLYLQYDAFTPRFRTYRNLDTFDLGEDKRLGPSVTLKAGRASTLLGSEADFFLWRGEAHVNAALLGGFQSIGASWEGRNYSYGPRDELVTGQVYTASPVLARKLRVVASATGGFMVNNVHRDFVYVGAIEGLRGYPVNEFYGSAYYQAHLEVRSMALPMASLRVGVLVFADAGHAAMKLEELAFYGDAGMGLRLLIPQLNAEVLRCDWALNFRTAGIQAGWPGRISCGFHQAL